MSLPLVFLKKKNSLAEQVAEHLLSDAAGNPPDLSRTQVWVPTSGASRRIRHALAKVAERGGSGVLSPSFLQPMAALLPKTATATRTDRELAWGLALKAAKASPPDGFDVLFPRPEVLEGDHALLGTASLICDLCDLLGEASLNPSSKKIREVCAEDEDRWSALGSLYLSYKRVMEAHGLTDPNEARAATISSPVKDLERVVIACIPDLPVAASLRARELEKQGVRVEVLVWVPESLPHGFDDWGRPRPEAWEKALIPLTGSQIVLAKDPADEAAKAIDFLAGAGGSHAAILGDASLTSPFQAAFLEREGRPFLPEGLPLGHTEPATVLSEWINLRREPRLRTLRRLLECPGFAGWACRKAGISQSLALEACDHLAMSPLVESLDQAAGFLDAERPEDPEERPIAREARVRREEAARSLLNVVVPACDDIDPKDIPGLVWHDAPQDFGSLGDVLESCSLVAGSSLLADWSTASDAALLRALARKRVFGSSSEGDTELSGLLEAPWSEASRMALCGCAEGMIPSSVDSHPFLPDGLRGKLGIADNASRRARDAYLLACLARVRSPENFRCSFAKFGADGTPAIPSGLLLRCPGKDLPERVTKLFAKPTASSSRPGRSAEWFWDLPEPSPLREKKDGVSAKISPTDFSVYLACPFRFYLKKRLWVDGFDPGVREMDALQFGDMIHRVLERFGKEHAGQGNEHQIRNIVHDFLKEEIYRRFGPDPSPVIRVQTEAARVRLSSFARVQAEQYAEGWRIEQVERKISAEDPLALTIGSLKLSSKIDRIDRRGGIIRVIDYKAQGGDVKTPAKTHFGPASSGWIKEASVMVAGKKGPSEKSWKELQLPLYRRIAEVLYPDQEVRTAYFILAADPSESRVEEFELTDEQMTSADGCARAVAEMVENEVFWPPRPHSATWDDPFEAFFINGNPEKCFSAETIARLKGRKGEVAS